MPFLFILLWTTTNASPIGVSRSQNLPSLIDPSNAYLIKQYIDAITAYGPGLGVYTPYSYVDISYDNLPGIGKIPLLGKEGTSSRLGISPFYPPEGHPGNPFPPLYKARPLPPHIPEPVDVVAVPLDEEALHGEPLFPPELTLPSDNKGVIDADDHTSPGQSKTGEAPNNPFGETTNEQLEEAVDGGKMDKTVPRGKHSAETNQIASEAANDVFFTDNASEKSTSIDQIEKKNWKESEREDQVPFARVVRKKRI